MTLLLDDEKTVLGSEDDTPCSILPEHRQEACGREEDHSAQYEVLFSCGEVLFYCDKAYQFIVGSGRSLTCPTHGRVSHIYTGRIR